MTLNRVLLTYPRHIADPLPAGSIAILAPRNERTDYYNLSDWKVSSAVGELLILVPVDFQLDILRAA